MKIAANRYSISVRRGCVDGETLFEARVKELPDLVEYGESLEEAYELAIDAIETTVAVLAEQGRPVPPPDASPDELRQRFTPRIPQPTRRAVHRD